MRDKYRLKIDKKVFFKPQLWNNYYKSLKKKQQPYNKIAINTGARVNEIRFLQVKHCQLEEVPPTITFYTTKVRSKRGEKRPVPRKIKISIELSQWLGRWIRKYKLKPEDTFSIPHTPAINKAIKNKLKKLGVENYLDFSSHNIRKTHGNWLLAIGMDGLKVASRMGHDANTLLKAYVSPDIFSEKDKEMIKEILGDLY